MSQDNFRDSHLGHSVTLPLGRNDSESGYSDLPSHDELANSFESSLGETFGTDVGQLFRGGNFDHLKKTGLYLFAKEVVGGSNVFTARSHVRSTIMAL